ncbi:MAG: FAD-dependent oxidoreductase [Leptospiraceae bacterium]|nr:FAD-dependent oxidoreductase [Leptospiraceae bacterium]
MKIAVIGGGYAGIAAAIELNRLGFGRQTTLFDKRLRHQKITQWHKLARGRHAEHYEVAFNHLAERFNFNFAHRGVSIDALLADSDNELAGNFDAIIIAQGSHTPANPPGVLTLDQLRDDHASQHLVMNMTGKNIAVIGGGPTGVQFAFEFAARGNEVDLYEARDRLLPTFDSALGLSAVAAAKRKNISLHLMTEFLEFAGGKIVCRNNTAGGGVEKRDADHVLFVPGVKSTPAFTCDQFGRLEYRSDRRFYAAGDNSYFSGRGLNTKSAQAAVRKGQHVARTVIADLEGKPVEEYAYPELGYFVSLGTDDAVGYLLSQKTAFSGRAALFMKEMIERQYNLYLQGFPVYP